MLQMQVNQLFASVPDGQQNEMFDEIYHGTCYLAYHVLHKSHRKVGDILEHIQPIDDIHSEKELKTWVLSALNVCLEATKVVNSQHDLICKVKRYIAEHLQGSCSRDEIARSVYLNPAYLSRLFKRETGISMTDYQIQLRMELAKDMLSSGSVSVSTVAETINCYNFSYFSRMFKKCVGVTPTEYRRNVSPAPIHMKV